MDSPEIKVLISYRHESPLNCETVLQLSQALRRLGIDCEIDQYHESPPEGWPSWMLRQIQRADFVVVVATAEYREPFEGKTSGLKGQGARFEGLILTQQIYDEETQNRAIIPVVFSEEDFAHVPTQLRGSTVYNLEPSGSGFEMLYRRLTGQPSAEPAPIGEIRRLPKKPGDGNAFQLPTESADRDRSLGVSGDGDRERCHPLSVLFRPDDVLPWGAESGHPLIG